MDTTALIFMILILGIVWGGLILMLRIASKRK
jgi:hypothetical protein